MSKSITKKKKDETRILDESSLHANDNAMDSDQDAVASDGDMDQDAANHSDSDGDAAFPVTDDMDGSLHRRLDNEDEAAEDRIMKSSMMKKKKHTNKTKRRKKTPKSRLVEDEAELSSDDNNSSDNDEDGSDQDNYEADGFVCNDDEIVYDEELVSGKKRLKKEQVKTSKSKRKHRRVISSDDDDNESGDDAASAAVHSGLVGGSDDEDVKIKDLRNGLVKLQSLSSHTNSATTVKPKTGGKPVLNRMSAIMMSKTVPVNHTVVDNGDEDKENIDPITGKVVPLSKIKQAAALASIVPLGRKTVNNNNKPKPIATANAATVSSSSSSKTSKPLTGQEAIERERERDKAKASAAVSKSKSKPKSKTKESVDEEKSDTTKSSSSSTKKKTKELVSVTSPAIQAYAVGTTFKFEDNKAKDADDKPVNGTYKVTCRGLNAPFDRDDNVIISKCTTKMYTTALRVGTTNVYQTFLVADQKPPHYLGVGNALKIEQKTDRAASRLDTARGCDNLQAVNDGTTNNRCIVPMSYYISSNRKRDKAAAKALITKSKERFSDSAKKVMDVCMNWFASKDPRGMEKLIMEADEKWKEAITAGDAIIDSGDVTRDDAKLKADKDDAITKKATMLFSKGGDKTWIREMMIFMFLYSDEYRGICKKELLCGATPLGGMELAANDDDEDSGENTQEDD